MEDKARNQQSSEVSRADDEPSTAMVDSDMSSVANVERSDGGFQDLEGSANSDGCVVQPSDVITIQEVQDDPVDINLGGEELPFPEEGILYEFPNDPEDAVLNSAGTDIFNPKDIYQVEYLNVKLNTFIECNGNENGKISEIKPFAISQPKEDIAENEAEIERSTARQSRNRNDVKRYGCESDNRTDKTLSYYSDNETYSNQWGLDQQTIPSYMSDEFEDDCDDPNPKIRQSSAAAYPIKLSREHRSDGCQFTDGSDESSGNNEMEDTQREDTENATRGFASKQNSIASEAKKVLTKTFAGIFSKIDDSEGNYNQGHKIFGDRCRGRISNETDHDKRSKPNHGASCSYPNASEPSDIKAQMNKITNGGKRDNFKSPLPAIVDEQKSQVNKVGNPDHVSLKMKKKVSQKNRCNECNVRLGLCAIRCRCGNFYCAKHRYDKDHSCTFDYKAMGAEEIRKNNPQVIAEKVRKL